MSLKTQECKDNSIRFKSLPPKPKEESKQKKLEEPEPAREPSEPSVINLDTVEEIIVCQP